MEKSVGSKIKKTPAFHPQLKTNEILISRKKPQLVYMKRVHELFFEKGQSEVYIQAIGAAVQQAVDLALQVQETYAGVKFESIDTFTMPLRDLLIAEDKESQASPLIQEAGPEILGDQMRFNSGICIKLTKELK